MYIFAAGVRCVTPEYQVRRVRGYKMMWRKGWCLTEPCASADCFGSLVQILPPGLPSCATYEVGDPYGAKVTSHVLWICACLDVYQDVLRDKVGEPFGLKAFRTFAAAHLMEENVDFWLEVILHTYLYTTRYGAVAAIFSVAGRICWFPARRGIRLRHSLPLR